jgi:hypothetical protein
MLLRILEFLAGFLARCSSLGMARSERVCIHFQCAPADLDGEESNVCQLSRRRRWTDRERHDVDGGPTACRSRQSGTRLRVAAPSTSRLRSRSSPRWSSVSHGLDGAQVTFGETLALGGSPIAQAGGTPINCERRLDSTVSRTT